MSSAATSEIPQEIIDLVIDHAQSDSPTLRALGLVSKAWSQRTREHLFCDIKLGARKLTRLSFFEERPSLRRCVKGLTIHCAPSHWLNDGQSESTLTILPLLESLTRVSILGQGEQSRSLNWKELLPRVRTALYEVMVRPHVTSITLSCIYDFDIVPLMHHHSFEELILDNVQAVDCISVGRGACFPLNNPSNPSSIPVRSRLRRLEATKSFRAFRVLLACSKRGGAQSLNLSNLTHLKVSTRNLSNLHEFTDAEWTSLFDLCGTSIGSYTAHWTARQKPFPPAIIPLNHFPNLKELFLKIHARVPMQHDRFFPVFVEALDRLSHAGTGTALTTMHVEYSGCSMYIENEVNALVDGEQWKWLDEIMQRPAFLGLKDVMFGFNIICCRGNAWGEGWDEHSGRVLSQLSSLDHRGILTLTRFPV